LGSAKQDPQRVLHLLCRSRLLFSREETPLEEGGGADARGLLSPKKPAKKTFLKNFHDKKEKFCMLKVF
jgi:hypothetical protein